MKKNLMSARTRRGEQMYQFVCMINQFVNGTSRDAAQTVSSWHNRREYIDEESGDEMENPSKTAHDPEDPDFIPTRLRLVIILSGKRKSGKDHISTLLTNYLGYKRMQHLAILRIAGPIKKEFARNNKLDFTRLLDSTEYKENFRLAMVRWSEEYREKEGWNCFLKQAIKEQKAKDKLIWILNDARRPCDLEYFEKDPAFQNTRVVKLRIEANKEARVSRGWKFVNGIDDEDTECGLDDYEDWTYVIENNFNDEKQLLNEALKPIFKEIDDALADL